MGCMATAEARDVQLQVRLTPSTSERLKVAADLQALDRATFVRSLIERALAPSMIEVWPVSIYAPPDRLANALQGKASLAIAPDYVSVDGITGAVYGRANDGIGWDGPLRFDAHNVYTTLKAPEEQVWVTRDGARWELVVMPPLIMYPAGVARMLVSLRRRPLGREGSAPKTPRRASRSRSGR